MAKASKIAAWKKPKKYAVREHNRCNRCGRPKAYIRHFGTKAVLVVKYYAMVLST